MFGVYRKMTEEWRHNLSLCVTCAGQLASHKRHTPLGGVTFVTLAWIVVDRSLATFANCRQVPNGRPILEKPDEQERATYGLEPRHGVRQLCCKLMVFLMGRPSNLEKMTIEFCNTEPVNWQDLKSRWRSCPAERKKHPNYQKSCSKCDGQICRRLEELGLDEGENPSAKNKRPSCGAKTRTGGQCQMKVVPGKRRCRLFAGLSTGPKRR